MRYLPYHGSFLFLSIDLIKNGRYVRYYRSASSPPQSILRNLAGARSEEEMEKKDRDTA